MNYIQLSDVSLRWKMDKTVGARRDHDTPRSAGANGLFSSQGDLPSTLCIILSYYYYLYYYYCLFYRTRCSGRGRRVASCTDRRHDSLERKKKKKENCL